MRRKFVIGNWKMNGANDSNVALVSAIMPRIQSLQRTRVAVCPPFPYLAHVRAQTSGSQLMVGAQDVSAETNGPFTGQVSGKMLHEIGCEIVIVGHSERRNLLGESSERVAQKAQQALNHGLTPIVCVGETLAERESHRETQVVQSQLAPVFSLMGQTLTSCVIAYEPVWAIGTGKSATADDAEVMHAFIRKMLREVGAQSVPILYGGSVKPDNADRLFSMENIDGGLIGGASLQPIDFVEICAARERC